MTTNSASSIACFPIQNYEQKLASERLRSEIKLYASSHRHYIMTTRFNDSTASENRHFRDKKQVGCLYGSSHQVATAIPMNAVMFVLELNISTKQIIGIGMVRNTPTSTLPYSIYKHGNYNRYMFSGKHRIDRKDFGLKEHAWIQLLENICFHGKRNLMRGSGLTRFPVEISYIYETYESLSFVDLLCKLFHKIMTTNSVSN